MTYLLAVLTLVTTTPGALLLATLRVLLALHVAVPACYLMYRLCGGQWDGLSFAFSVLEWVHELRRKAVPHFSEVSPAALRPLPARTRNS